MYCNKKDCRKVSKSLKRMTLEELENQVDHCERCCFKKEVEEYKDNTYKDARLKYVSAYWENLF